MGPAGGGTSQALGSCWWLKNCLTVSLAVYVCVFARAGVHTCVCPCTGTGAYACKCVHTAYICVCAHACVYACMCACVRTRVYVCMCIRVCICMHVCARVHACVCVCVGGTAVATAKLSIRNELPPTTGKPGLLPPSFYTQRSRCVCWPEVTEGQSQDGTQVQQAPEPMPSPSVIVLTGPGGGGEMGSRHP